MFLSNKYVISLSLHPIRNRLSVLTACFGGVYFAEDHCMTSLLLFIKILFNVSDFSPLPYTVYFKTLSHISAM